MYTLIRNTELAEASFQQYDLTNPIFVDTETCQDEGKSKGGLYGQVRLVQVYQIGWKQAIIYDCYFVDLQVLLKKLQPFHHVYHNASYDLHTINCYTEQYYIPKDVDDTLYLGRLKYYEKTSRFGFYECLRAASLEDDNIRNIDKKANQKSDWGGVLTPTMLKYAAMDVLYLSLLYEDCKDMLEDRAYQLDKVSMIHAIEYSRRGIPIHTPTLQKMLLKATTAYEKVLLELPVNPNSPKQCKELLGTEKTDMDTLEHLKLEGNKQAGMIRDARQLSKTVTFLKRYKRDRIYGFYNACGTITGRMSCTGGDRYDHANTQQIPRRVLPCIQAGEGKVLVYKDYAGLELRMAVVWVGEPTMERLMREGTDVHTYTGAIIYKKPMEQLTDYERMIGKICNFLLVYGGSVNVLQATIRAWGQILMPLDECRDIHRKWFEAYPYFKAWHDMNKRMLNVYGYADVYTALGRNVRAYSINDALNIPIQGSSSEVTKMSLKYLKERYPDENLISTIHDSNTLEVDENDADLWIGRLNECMIDAWYYVIKDLELPDLPMPPEAKSSKVWDF